jgi:protein-tyrosine phosphatase
MRGQLAMIDIHTHVLPGVDDGSPSIEVSVRVLERFAAGGVKVVVCTPHLDASAACNAPHDAHAAIFEQLCAAAPRVPELHRGWEIMLDVPNIDLRDPRLSLGGSKAVLVEFPLMGAPPNAAEELFRLRMSGVVPVLAHPERYRGCTVADVEAWRRGGVVIQMDAAGLFGSDRIARLAREMLAAGCVDIVASDTHADQRSLVAVRDWLYELDSPAHADLLTRENARRLLADERLEPVPPLVAPHGMLERLRELVLGRRRQSRIEP